MKDEINSIISWKFLFFSNNTTIKYSLNVISTMVKGEKMKNQKHVLFNISNIGKNKKINTTISYAKGALSINEINEYIDKLLKIPYLNREEILKSPFPKKIEELGQKRVYFSSGDVEKELVWNSRFIFHYSREINQFIEQRDLFNRLILLGFYEHANDILNNIEEKFGFSYWLIENKIFLLQELFGLEKHKEYLHSIKKDDSKVSVFVKYFASYISIKMEENVSVEKYNLRISEVIQREKDNFASENLIEYIKYKLYLKEYFPVAVLPVLVFESNLSLIDRYCNLIRIMRNMENKISDYSNKLIIGNLADIKDDLSARILKKNGTNIVLPILDKYTKGEYDQVVKLCSQELEIRPFLVDLYPIYIRSNIRLEKHDQIWPEGSLLSIILNGLRDMYLSTSKFDEAYSNLKKISYIFCNNEWAWQLRGLVEEVSNYNRDDKLIELYKKYVQPDNPLYVRTSTEYSTGKSDQIEMLTGNEDSITLKLYEYIHDENIAKIEKLNIPEYRKMSIIASIYRKNGNSEFAKQIYEKLIDDKVKINEIEGTIGYVESCIELCTYKEAIELIVNQFLNQNTLVKQVSLAKLFDNIQKNIESADQLNKLIDFPILYDIYSKFYSVDRESEKGEAYEEFLLNYNVKRPSQLNIEKMDIPKKKLIYFLRYVCIESVMDYSMFFNSTEEIKSERIIICQLLRNLDPKNEELYSNEIKEITQKQIINRGLREIEKSKIYVDVAGIKKSMERETKENYFRYKSLVEANIKDEAPIYITLEEGIEEFDGQILELMMPSDERRQLFNRIVFDLRDSFVSSNEYGLDGYLSVGIRHGTLSGQLRAPLEEKHLITQKDSETGMYQLSSFWESKDLNEEFQNKITLILDKFGKTVDSLIDKLKNQWIQIKTETSNPKGLFNFQMYLHDLERLERSVSTDTTYEELVDSIFDELWKKTDVSLLDMRKQINGELKDEFNEAFDFMLVEIDKLKEKIDITDLKEQIISSKTTMQYELEKISQWFTRNNSSYMSSFSADIILDIVHELTKNIYNNQEIILKKHVDKIHINGGKLKSFVDVMFILFDNIIKHSHVDENINVEVNIERRKDRLLIRCSNEISEDIVTMENNERIEVIKRNINKKKEMSYVSREGGSGFYKIEKIITVDLNCPLTMNFDYSKDQFIVELDIESRGVFYEDINH